MALDPMIARGVQAPDVANTLMNVAELRQREQANSLYRQRYQDQQDEEERLVGLLKAGKFPEAALIDPDTTMQYQRFLEQQALGGLGDIPVQKERMAVPEVPQPLVTQRIPGVGTAVLQGGKPVPGMFRAQPQPQRTDKGTDQPTPQTDGNAPQRPLPVGALRIVDEAKQAMAAADESKTIVGKAVKALESGNVKLGAVQNLESRARNYAGMSDENSRAYGGLRQTLEKLRNNYLLLAKGVQTEGDAQRAWNSEIGESVQNDNELALQQLKRAQEMIDRALSAQQGRIDTVYSNFGMAAPEEQQSLPSPPQAAIDALRRDPSLAPQFMQKYGRLPQGFNGDGR